MTARDAAINYMARGWSPIPVPWRSKDPGIKDWPKLRVTGENVGQYFNGARQNIGILLGELSCGLVDIDLDCPEAVVAARHLLPDTGCVFGRAGNPRSHHLFISPGVKTRKLTAPDGEVLLELRATGIQTIFPPSTHPSGEAIEWLSDNGPAQIEGARLTRIVGLVAAAALIARRWPTHGRHDATLALAGALRRADWTLDQATLFVRAVAEAAHDEEARDRERAVTDTYARDGTTTGWPRIGELLGGDVAGRLREWLDTRPADERAPQGVNPDPTNDKDRTEPGLTDLGNAHRFAQDHRADVRYCWPWGRWLVWNGRYWCRDETGKVHRLAEATVRGMYQEAALSSEERRAVLASWAVKSESHERRIKMLASAQAIEGIPIQPEDMDRDVWLLNVLNGTIDLRIGTLRPHAREDYITRCLDVDYDPKAVCPVWERFVYEAFGGNAETIAFVQRAIGYSLTGRIIEHVLIVLYGLGSNGKTTLIDALHYLLGPSYAKHTPTDLLLARRGEHHPTELATLHGARLVTAAETGEGRRLAESLVKQLTGGDPVTARRMREDFWQYRPEFKLWLATNHKPQIRGTDHAIWRRIRLIPFDVTFHAPETGKTPQQDPTLSARLRAELPGILAWAVRGCLAWHCQGLKTPQAIRDATEGYRAEMDVFAAFVEDCCVFDKRAETGARELYRAYTRWCEGSGEHAESQTSFGTRLRERGLVHGSALCPVSLA